MFGAVVAELDVERYSDAALAEDLVATSRQIDELFAKQARLAEAFARRHVYRADGSLTMISWLRNHCRLSNWTATELMTLATQMPELPQAQAAFEAGEMSYENARIMARTAAAVGSDRYREGEELMVKHAARFSPNQFRLLNERVKHMLSPERALSDANQLFDRRWVKFSPLMDGMYALDGLLDAETGAALQTALDPLMRPGGGDDRRSAGQRRADALGELARRMLDSGGLPLRGGQKPQLTIVARSGAAGHLDWGGLVPVETVERIGCDCSLTPIVVGPDGTVIEAGRRRRSFSAREKRLLRLKYGGCCGFPIGCDTPTQWTDAHHLVPVSQGGPSTIENGVPLCRRHHRMVHEGGWRLHRGPGGDLIPIPP